MRYPAKGAPELAVVARDLIAAVGYEATLDERRGLDHGAWVPLLYLAPNAATPVLQVSLGARVDAQAAIDLGSVLSSLRTEGVMIVGSGSLTHNLHEYFQGSTDTAYALEFVQWIQQALSQRDTASLVNYREAAPHARRAHPTEEHLLPLFVAYGASNDDDSMTLLDGGLDRALSMDSYLWARGSTGTEAKACAAA
jgi:4,5-DOPA dioxygenase extradiol